MDADEPLASVVAWHGWVKLAAGLRIKRNQWAEPGGAFSGFRGFPEVRSFDGIFGGAWHPLDARRESGRSGPRIVGRSRRVSQACTSTARPRSSSLGIPAAFKSVIERCSPSNEGAFFRGDGNSRRL